MTRDEVHALTGLAALVAITAAWWALALWPVEAVPWLERTRYVCFGVTGNGLPDTGGWIGLIGGPLGMLAILIAGWHTGMRGLLRRARAIPAVGLALLVLALAVAAMVTGAGLRVSQARAAASGLALETLAYDDDLPPPTYPRLDREAPALALVTQHADTLDLRNLRGRPVLVTFAYAHCETVCPLVVRHVLDAQAALAGTPDAPAVVVVTLDPWRDTPSRLPAMAANWGLPGDGAWVVGGRVEDVERTLDAWHVPRRRDERTGEVTHPSLVYVIDRDGTLAYATTGGAAAVAELVRRLRA